MIQAKTTLAGNTALSSLYEIIVASARAALETQLDDGSMPPGHNGPYHDPETPVRNTSHWSITFLKAYEISGDDAFRAAAKRATGYLMREEFRPNGYTFWHRTKPNKDACNGLIGSAWTIEALVAAGQYLRTPGALDLASQVFLLNPLDEDVGLWRIIEIDGRDLGFDNIFNHQLWFAAAGGLLMEGRRKDVAGMISRFLNSLSKNMAIYPNGLIKHFVAGRQGGTKAGAVGRTKIVAARLIKRRRLRTLNDEDLRYRAVGYHSFNLYAFAVLAKAVPDHPFWRTETFVKVLRYADSEEYCRQIDDNKYGYPYNPPGFELPYAMSVFPYAFRGDLRLESAAWVSNQLQRCFDPESNQMIGGTEDERTQAARLYEATRLADVRVALHSA